MVTGEFWDPPDLGVEVLASTASLDAPPGNEREAGISELTAGLDLASSGDKRDIRRRGGCVSAAAPVFRLVCWKYLDWTPGLDERRRAEDSGIHHGHPTIGLDRGSLHSRSCIMWLVT